MLTSAVTGAVLDALMAAIDTVLGRDDALLSVEVPPEAVSIRFVPLRESAQLVFQFRLVAVTAEIFGAMVGNALKQMLASLVPGVYVARGRITSGSAMVTVRRPFVLGEAGASTTVPAAIP